MWIAAESGDLATALVPAVWTFLGIVVVTLGTIAVQSMKGRSERTSEPVTTTNGNGATQHLMRVARDIGQLDERANDNDARDDVQDRRHDRSEGRLEALERYHDHRDPGWRDR